MVYALVYTTLALAGFMASVLLGGPYGALLKMAASTGFLAIAIAAGALHHPYGRAVLAALVFSWWGDLFLISGKESIFLMGLAAFLAGHLAFSAAFLIHGVSPRWFAAGLVLVLVAGALDLRWLNPHLGGVRYPVYAYTAVISLMLALAIGTGGNGAARWIVVGALLFYLSDLFVARQKFVTSSVWNPRIGLPTYYAAQMILAWSIARVHPPEA